MKQKYINQFLEIFEIESCKHIPSGKFSALLLQNRDNYYISVHKYKHYELREITYDEYILLKDDIEKIREPNFNIGKIVLSLYDSLLEH